MVKTKTRGIEKLGSGGRFLPCVMRPYGRRIKTGTRPRKEKKLVAKKSCPQMVLPHYSKNENRIVSVMNL